MHVYVCFIKLDIQKSHNRTISHTTLHHLKLRWNFLKTRYQGPNFWHKSFFVHHVHVRKIFTNSTQHNYLNLGLGDVTWHIILTDMHLRLFASVAHPHHTTPQYLYYWHMSSRWWQCDCVCGATRAACCECYYGCDWHLKCDAATTNLQTEQQQKVGAITIRENKNNAKQNIN